MGKVGVYMQSCDYFNITFQYSKYQYIIISVLLFQYSNLWDVLVQYLMLAFVCFVLFIHSPVV